MAVLLALDGLLLLAVRFHWFAFENPVTRGFFWMFASITERKGWAVLVALASAVVAILLMLLWFVASLLFRWRFQFSIRSVLWLVVVVAIPCSWLAVERKEASKQHEVVEAIRKLGGTVWYDYQYSYQLHFFTTRYESASTTPSGPAWGRQLLGDEFFTNVAFADFQKTRVTDAWLEHLKGVAQLQVLNLDGTQVTDAGLEQLSGLTQLRALNLDSTRVTDAGLKHLKGLRQLERLSLRWTQLTDAGFEHLKGLTQLRSLYLNGTKVTGAGFVHLKGLKELSALELSGTQVTDAGLEHLKELRLSWLHLRWTPVTDAGMEHLKGMHDLELLDLRNTKVTEKGVKKLRQYGIMR
jgi:hypothetical protein